MRKVVVIGNGPSLKAFDFSSLEGIDSIGMNAAYRYWDEINWYPTHYVCLDDQLIETHATEIYRLVTARLVKTAFLMERILDFHPDLFQHKNIVFLESFVRGKYRRTRRSNLPFIDSRFFLDSDSSKITTGAYAVRYAAYLKYDAITLLGIDLNYVELIPEAKKGEGISLKMTSTPKKNPNYFFDHYQQEGDRFNIPNPALHGVNLHVRSFDVLRYDMYRHKWRASVLNSNLASELFARGHFPYVDIEDFLRLKRAPFAKNERFELAWTPSFFQKLQYHVDLILAHILSVCRKYSCKK